METNTFPGSDNIRQLYNWDCYTRRDLIGYVDINCLTKEEYIKICGESLSED